MPWTCAIICLMLLMPALPLRAYSVLTHEAIIDSAWDRKIKPFLLNRFPAATEDQFIEAHGYAYGGCIIHDMGYYPFGSKFFSDLVHYVRTGTFVENMLAEAGDLNELAFALGSLAHYAADNLGHSVAVNRAVAMQYPELRSKFGDLVTYAESPAAHMKTEFGFDVLQVARGNYAPKAYHEFVGFEVSKPLLERAFLRTYGLELKDVFTSVDLALGSYRFAVSQLIPQATKVAWDLKEDELVREQPGRTRQKFLYNLSRASFEKEWGRQYQRPGFFARLLALCFRLIPRIGPFRGLDFRPPSAETAKLFMESFNRTLEMYFQLLGDAAARRVDLENRDFDTGKPTRAGEYRLADQAYARLARKLAERPDAGAPLRAEVLAFFDGSAPAPANIKPKEWRETRAALEKLRAAGGAAPSAGNPDGR